MIGWKLAKKSLKPFSTKKNHCDTFRPRLNVGDVFYRDDIFKGGGNDGRGNDGGSSSENNFNIYRETNIYSLR